MGVWIAAAARVVGLRRSSHHVRGQTSDAQAWDKALQQGSADGGCLTRAAVTCGLEEHGPAPVCGRLCALGRRCASSFAWGAGDAETFDRRALGTLGFHPQPANQQESFGYSKNHIVFFSDFDVGAEVESREWRADPARSARDYLQRQASMPEQRNVVQFRGLSAHVPTELGMTPPLLPARNELLPAIARQPNP